MSIFIFMSFFSSCDNDNVDPIDPADSPTDIDYFMHRHIKISGTVKDANGIPVSNAIVYYNSISVTFDSLLSHVDIPQGLDSLSRITEVKPDGRYLLQNVITELFYPFKECCDSLWVVCEPAENTDLQKDSALLVLKKSFSTPISPFKDSLSIVYEHASVDFILENKKEQHLTLK